MKNVYSFSRRLEAQHVDRAGRWTMVSAIQSMQMAADRHARELNAAKEDLAKNRWHWVVARLRVRMERYPAYGDDVTVVTWPGAPRRMIYPRFFRFLDAAGAELGSASNYYMIVDDVTRGAVIADPASIYGGLQLRGETGPVPEKIVFRGGAGCGETRRAVCYSDIDFFGHMNNARYAEWVCDLFPTARYETAPLADFQLNFISEGLEGHVLALALDDNGAAFTVQGTDTDSGSVVFAADGRW